MAVKIDGDTITFSSGRTLYANCGIVGINPALEIYEGYDGSITWPIPEWSKTDESLGFKLTHQNTLTVEDMRDLADHMIDSWTTFKGTLK